MSSCRIFFNILHPVKEGLCVHPLLARQLEGVYLQKLVGAGYAEVLPVGNEGADA